MFRGHCPTRLDEKGRLKIPADFKHEIDKNYDGTFYVTSLDGKVIKLYPLREWEAFEQKILHSGGPRRKLDQFTGMTSYYGQTVALDAQGRLTIAEWLRNEFGLKGEVSVIGKFDHLELQLSEEFRKAVKENPLTPEDIDELLRPGS
jgi:transcriptional regulator MraZ